MQRTVAIKPFKPAATAKGRHRPEFGEMNKLEAKYAAHLESLRLDGTILWWKFGALGLSLAKKTWYRPDFMVMLASGEMEIHETKGFWEDDARVKIKVAAELFPFRFVAIQAKAKKHGGGWSVEVIGDPQPKGAA